MLGLSTFDQVKLVICDRDKIIVPLAIVDIWVEEAIDHAGVDDRIIDQVIELRVCETSVTPCLDQKSKRCASLRPFCSIDEVAGHVRTKLVIAKF